jgi:hypothetical protein
MREYGYVINRDSTWEVTQCMPRVFSIGSCVLFVRTTYFRLRYCAVSFRREDLVPDDMLPFVDCIKICIAIVHMWICYLSMVNIDHHRGLCPTKTRKTEKEQCMLHLPYTRYVLTHIIFTHYICRNYYTSCVTNILVVTFPNNLLDILRCHSQAKKLYKRSMFLKMWYISVQ